MEAQRDIPTRQIIQMVWQVSLVPQQPILIKEMYSIIKEENDSVTLMINYINI